MVQAPDGLKVEAAKGAEVEIKAQGNLAQSIAALEQMPGTAWVKELANNPNVNWSLVSEAHEHWNYKSQGLTPAASAVLALAVTIATGGAGSGLSGAMGLAQSGIAAGVVEAGVSHLITQASLSLINNQGNLGKVLKEMGSNASVRSFATAVATAGLVGSGSTTNIQGFSQKLFVKSVHALGKASMSAAIEGDRFGV